MAMISKDYRVVCGRVLGDVTDTTSSAGNTITKNLLRRRGAVPLRP